MEVSSSIEFFDEIIKSIGDIVGSFSPGFPETTAALLKSLDAFITEYITILNPTRPIDSQLRDAVIEFIDGIRSYARNLKDPNTSLGRAAQLKDFNSARDPFKDVARDKFALLLLPTEPGKPAPSTCRNATSLI